MNEVTNRCGCAARHYYNEVEEIIIDNMPTFIFSNKSLTIIYLYHKPTKTLYRNDTAIINNIENFTIDITDASKFNIKITLNNKVYETNLAFSKGN